MVILEGGDVGQIVLRGAGAGEGPTASAVMSDVVDLARGLRLNTFGQAATVLVKSQPATTATTAQFYLRLQLLDKPGALAKVAAVMGDAGVSIDRMRQYGHDAEQTPVLIVTHKTTRAAIDQNLEDFAKTRVVEGQPVALRIEAV